MLIYHESVLDINQRCAAVCNQRPGFSVGPDYRKAPMQCLECDDSLNRVYNPATGTCVCKPGCFLTPNNQC